MKRSEIIFTALRESWCAETAYVKQEWSRSNPARGQCVPTVLIVQDFLGGDIVKFFVVRDGEDKAESHYANLLPSGAILDVTRDQYSERCIRTEAKVDLTGFSSIREKLLSDISARKRYLYLKQKVESALRLLQSESR